MSTKAAHGPNNLPVALPLDLDPRLDEAFAEDGFAGTDDDGDIVRSKDKVVQRTTAVLVSDALATDEEERVKFALTKKALYERVFPHGPRDSDSDPLDQQAAAHLAIYVWSLTTPSYQGRVQRQLGDTEGATDLVLCRRKINGDPCVYVTRNDELVVDDFVAPGKVKLVKAAERTRRDMALVSQRRGPALEQRIAGELERLALETTIALGVGPGLRALDAGGD